MAVVRDTKGMFAEELESMMGRMPLSKVRVRDLCERCGVEATPEQLASDLFACMPPGLREAYASQGSNGQDGNETLPLR